MGKIKIMGKKIILNREIFFINPPPCPEAQNQTLQGEIRRVWARIKKLGFLGVLFYVTWRSILAGFVPSHARASGLFKGTIFFMAAPAFYRAKPRPLTPSESSPTSPQSSLHEIVSNIDKILVLHDIAINLPPICVLHLSG